MTLRHFLEQYFARCKHDYGNIEDDTYIFPNLGYHLFKSQQMHLFSGNVSRVYHIEIKYQKWFEAVFLKALVFV